jgi:hypothetical protein
MLTMKQPRATLEKIASAQKLLLWAILAAIVVNLGAMAARASLQSNPVEPSAAIAINLAMVGLQVSIVVLQIAAVIQLCLALEEGWATIVYVLLQCVPCLNLVLLLFLNGRATSYLKKAGIRVGLMGANSADVANYQPKARKCPACGEPLDGAMTSCPMCGEGLARGGEP